MSINRLMTLIDSLIDDARAAVLATVDKKGAPRLRWITPGSIADRPGFLYMITAHDFEKVVQAKEHPDASILLQSRQLDRVLQLQGVLTVLENPVIRNATLERISHMLNAFWKTGSKDRELVVLEFRITEAVFYRPMSGEKEKLLFDGETK
ncbi:MAG: pyridoxamine 5'-phosphate oxidase family protein [Chitinispirillaceae bacterium]|nr:pyridoxamine 5'-phosphate oxidase family protein [Chitinispirillaceae bacterium]